MVRPLRPASLVGLLLLLVAACSTAAAHDQAARVADGSTTTATSSTTTSTTTTLPPTTTTVPPTTTTAPPPPPPSHVVTDGHDRPLAQAGGVVIVHPSTRVERVGFHQSTLDGSQELDVLPTAIGPSTLNTRDRTSGPRTAADVVVEPGTTVLAPASGTVVKAGHYRLYCAYDDETVVIAPDARTSWVVMVLHLQGVSVAVGQHVDAGVTPIATQAHQLPFKSQVDKLSTVKPAWPHVHVEIDDPGIPDTPSKGDSC